MSPRTVPPEQKSGSRQVLTSRIRALFIDKEKVADGGEIHRGRYIFFSSNVLHPGRGAFLGAPAFLQSPSSESDWTSNFVKASRWASSRLNFGISGPRLGGCLPPARWSRAKAADGAVEAQTLGLVDFQLFLCMGWLFPEEDRMISPPVFILSTAYLPLFSLPSLRLGGVGTGGRCFARSSFALEASWPP